MKKTLRTTALTLKVTVNLDRKPPTLNANPKPNLGP